MTNRSATHRAEPVAAASVERHTPRANARPSVRAARVITGWAITAAGAAIQYAELRGTF